jgi:ParB-like chromosome segregation protein Spo0J
MTQITLNTSDLKRSESNVRGGHSKEDIYTMATSIKNRGIINPPSVAKNGDGRYEVVAGQLRVAGAIAAGIKKIDCIDVTELTVDEIGSRFDKKEREVQQVLAVGGLPKKILDSADRGDIGDRTLRALAVAPKADVRRYMKLKLSDRPRDWEIQEWLAGSEGRYLAKNALFDLELYKGGSYIDLFAEEDEVWLTDGGQFWDLQAAAYDAKLADFEKKGWQTEILEYWQSWAYEKTAKKNGGRVFWTKDEKTGAIAFYVGYARLNRAGSAPKPKDGKPEKKPDTSKAFDDYCTELRHNAVCAAMVCDVKNGLVASVVLLLKQCDNIQLRHTGGRVKSESYINSINEQDDNLDIQDARLNMWNELGIESGMTWDLDIAKVTKQLLACTPATLQRYIIAILASEWAVDGDGKDGDAIGKAIGLNGVDRVTLDDGFWNGITNKATLIAIAKEHKIVVNEKMTVKVIRAKVKDGVPESWLPDYLTF